MSAGAIPGVFLVVARAANGVIGIDGGIPWRLPTDLKHFRALTIDKTVIMGRKTFASLPGTLPRRRHIVITRDAGWEAEGVEVAQDEDAALWLAGAGAPGVEVAVIGGAEIYALLLPFAERIELTEIHEEYPGETVLPPFDSGEWRETRREPQQPADGEPRFDFVTLERVA